MSRPRERWGAIVNEVRRMLAEQGAVSTWEIRQIPGADPSNATRALVKSGEAVNVRGSTLYARPDVAAEIEAVIARHAAGAARRSEAT